ncbi:GAF domain-containing protein [Sanguibacter sp. 25GB23B1]|uniref:helix-turn-helix domain-containing protein n=1 Tax=unclassified Sanguibacter TaxID=2645534 RepID=UPI0032AEEBBF
MVDPAGFHSRLDQRRALVQESLVRESWRRSVAFRLDPDAVPDALDLTDAALRERRAAHPLAVALPTIQQLLVRHADDSGLIVAIGDQTGRLLWVAGDAALRRRAEAMAFVEGADWSERAAGTSAPGTALVLDRAVQIRRTEHYSRIVHPWSCTAVPVHDRATGAVVGVIDVTGGDDAVGPVTLPLLEATVAAVEAEIQVHRLEDERHRARRPSSVRRAPSTAGATVGSPVVQRSSVPTEALLTVLGREEGLLREGDRSIVLSARHAEILTLLAWHRRGLTAEALADAVYGRADAVVTVRAEMVRLRKVLEAFAPELVPLSRPYRLDVRLELDAHRVLAFLDRGAHRVALGCYVGAVLPGSTAPGIQEIRSVLAGQVRESLLADAGVDLLLEYARTDESRDDVALWETCLQLLPARSPRRASVVAHLEALETELGAVR